MKVPEFQKEYRGARRAAFDRGITRLQQATSAAETMLLKTMIEPATSASVKVHAAGAISDGVEAEEYDQSLTTAKEA